MMLVFQVLRGRAAMSDLLKPDRIHHAIIGALAFAFVAAGLGAQFSETFLDNNFFVLLAGCVGGAVGKVIVI